MGAAHPGRILVADNVKSGAGTRKGALAANIGG